MSERPKTDGSALTREALLAALESLSLELARTQGWPMPVRVYQPGRRLKRPWFASPLAPLRAVLNHESPATFRARNLFISENALSRA